MKPYKHLQYLEQAVVETLNGTGPPNLKIAIPIRHGKTELIARALPAWLLTIRPDTQIMNLSYNSTFAAKSGTVARNYFREFAPGLTGVCIDSERETEWTVKNHRGCCFSAGTGTNMGGRNADLIISDDQVGSQEDAESATMRDTMWRWWTSDAYTRLLPGGKCIVIGSRRAQDDLFGRLQQTEEAGGAKWRTIRLPIFAEPKDPLDRALGETLCPDLWSQQVMEDKQRNLIAAGKAYEWEVLYAQNEVGNPDLYEFPIDYWESILYDELPPGLPIQLRILGSDPSKGTTSKTGDYCAIIYAAIDSRGTMWVEDSIMRNMPISEVEACTIAMIRQHNIQAWVQDCNSFQSGIADHIQANLSHPLPYFLPYANQLKKEVRIKLELDPYLRARRVRIKKTPSNMIILNQLKIFGSRAHDDGPDCLSMCWSLLASLQGNTSEPPLDEIC